MGVSKQTVFKFVDYTVQKKENTKPINIISRFESKKKMIVVKEKNESNLKRDYWSITKSKLKNKVVAVMK